MRAVEKARMPQRLRHRQVGVVQRDVFSHQPDADVFLRRPAALDHVRPLAQVGRRRVDAQFAADHLGEAGAFQHQRRFIQIGQRSVFDHAVRADVAEQRNLAVDGFLQRLVAAQDDDVRVDAHALQFLDRMLRGLGLMLVRAAQERHERHMDEQAVFPPDLERNLPHGLQKRLGFDVADGAADFGDDHVRARFGGKPVHELLDFVGDVRNHLHGRAEVLPASLLVEHVPVHLAGRQIGIAVEVLVNEALVMAQIQVGLRPVLGDVHLAMLVGTHCPGVYVDIRVQLLRGDLQAARLEQPPQRRRGDALSESRDHAARHKYVFCHPNFPLQPPSACSCSTLVFFRRKKLCTLPCAAGRAVRRFRRVLPGKRFRRIARSYSVIMKTAMQSSGAIVRAQIRRSALPLCGRRGRCPDSASS